MAAKSSSFVHINKKMGIKFQVPQVALSFADS